MGHPSPHPNTNLTVENPPQLCNSIGLISRIILHLIPTETLFVSNHYQSVQSIDSTQKHTDKHRHKYVKHTKKVKLSIHLYNNSHGGAFAQYLQTCCLVFAQMKQLKCLAPTIQKFSTPTQLGLQN